MEETQRNIRNIINAPNITNRRTEKYDPIDSLLESHRQREAEKQREKKKERCRQNLNIMLCILAILATIVAPFLFHYYINK